MWKVGDKVQVSFTLTETPTERGGFDPQLYRGVDDSGVLWNLPLYALNAKAKKVVDSNLSYKKGVYMGILTALTDLYAIGKDKKRMLDDLAIGQAGKNIASTVVAWDWETGDPTCAAAKAILTTWANVKRASDIDLLETPTKTITKLMEKEMNNE